jgi:hypothetical protein
MSKCPIVEVRILNYEGYMRKLFSKVFLILLALAIPSAFAHHSFAMFDQTKKVEFTGKVSEIQWTNPHVWIMVDVPGENESLVTWGVEFTSKVHLTRRGFSPTMFSVGDEVTFSVSPYGDGSPGGRFFWVQLADGSFYCDVGAAQRVCQENNSRGELR